MGNCLNRRKKAKAEEKFQEEKDVTVEAQSKPAVNEKNDGSANPHVLQSKTLKSWEIRKQNINKEDYIIKNKENETFVKRPGSISGQQFTIESCKIIRLAYSLTSAMIAISLLDLAHQGEVFKLVKADLNLKLGPYKISVFLRDSTNCNMVIACQQFRSRKCKNIKMLMFSQTQPIIESSEEMQFGCFNYGYIGLRAQFDQAKLNIWNNSWSEIHDFTKKEKGLNYSYLKEELIPSDLMPRLSADQDYIDLAIEDHDRKSILQNLIVPVTSGLRTKFGEACLVLIYPDFYSNAENLVTSLNLSDEIFVIRSKAIKLVENQVETLFLDDKEMRKQFKTLIDLKRHLLFIHVSGSNTEQNLHAILRDVTGSSAAKDCYYLWADKEVVKNHSTAVFETWREEN